MKNILLLFFTLMSFLTFGQTSLIYTQDFAATNPTGWTVVNAGTGNNWSMVSTSGPYNGSYAMVYSYNSTNAANTRAFTQGVSMTAGRTYRVEFYQKVGSSLYTEKMKVTVGNAQTAASQTTTLLDLTALTNTTYTNQVTAEYSCTSTGTYYFSFNCYSAKNKLTLHVDNVRIYETIPTVPTCATITAPSNGGTGISLSQTLQWASVAGATSYDVYFGTSTTPPYVTNVTTTTYTPTLAGATTYYWKIVAKNSAGSATGCSTWSFTTVSPPSNDACSGATSLPCATSALAGTTVNSVSETPPASASVSNYGVWYKFTGDGQQTTVSSTAVFDHEMVILTGTSCGSFAIVTSQDGAGSNGTETYTFTTTNGQQYYVFIAHYSTGNLTTGTFTISRTCTAAPTPPSNDACSAATSLPCATSNLAGTTVNSVSETSPGGGWYASNYGVWYTFTGDGGQTTVSATGNSFDIEMTIVSGTCGSNTLVSSQDAGTTETYTFTTTNSTVYYVYIGYWNSGGTSTDVGTFTISRTCVTPPSNNNCSSAPALTINSGTSCTTSTNGTTVGATQSSTSCTGTADDDVWYSFVANGTSQTITVTPGTLSDAVFQVYSGTCAGLTSLACVDNTSGSSTETTTVTGLTNGVTYYVRVHSYGNSTGQGTFSICATTPCTTPTTAGTLSSNKTSTTVNDAVVFTTTGNGGSITKFEYSYDNFSTVEGTVNNPANPYTLILNVQQPTMWFRTTSVSGACPAGVTTPISVTLQSAPEYIYGTEDGDYISNVTLNTINNNSTYDSPLGDSYQDFTSISTTLVKGTNYTIYVSSPGTFLGYPSGYAAWIDYNNDGIFQTTENIMQTTYGTTKSQSFTVPTTASVALVTMRVLSSWAETPTTDAYDVIGYDYGEIEEYKINITSGLPVELYSFDGINKGEDNYLFWVTASEQNTSHFNLQKSRDGETWITITTLNASGNSNTQIDYDVVDYKVEPIINYYRLQQYDNDGVYETFGPISINNMDLGTQKTIVKYINLNGQEIDPNKLNLMDVYIEVYDDGTMRKIIK